MKTLVFTVIAALIAGFLTWLARQYYFRRRLTLVRPKLFDYSGSGNSHGEKHIELKILNEGRRTEDDLELRFSPNFKYKIIASNRAGLIIDNNAVLKIERLLGKQEITLIINARGGDFQKEHILGLESKAASGKIRENVQQQQQTGLQVSLAIIMIFLLIPTFGYFFGTFIKIAIWPPVRDYFSPVKKLNYVINSTSNDFILEPHKKYGIQLLKTVKIVSVKRRGDTVYLSTELNNSTQQPLKYSMRMTSADSGDRGSWVTYDYIISPLELFPGFKKRITLNDYLPKDFKPQAITFSLTVYNGNNSVDSEKVLYLKD